MSISNNDIINALSVPTTQNLSIAQENYDTTYVSRKILQNNIQDAISAFEEYQKCENNPNLRAMYSYNNGRVEKEYYKLDNKFVGGKVTEKYEDIRRVYEETVDNEGQLVIDTKVPHINYDYYTGKDNSYRYNSNSNPIEITNQHNNGTSIKLEYGDNYFIGGVDYYMDGGGDKFDYTCIYEFDNKNRLAKTTEQESGSTYTSTYKYNDGALEGQVIDVDVNNSDDKDYTAYVKFDNSGRPEIAYIDNHKNDAVADSPILSFLYGLFGGTKDEVIIYNYDSSAPQIENHNDKFFTKQDIEELNILFK